MDIADFGRAKEPWLRTFLELPHGIPSHDTFARLFAVLNPRGFEQCFQSWIAALAGSSQGKLIAMDGKTLRQSLDWASGKAAIHMVSVWVHKNHAVFGQVRTEDKSNEITAVPQLLEMLNLKAATGPLDAMGCQRDIAQKVLDKAGHHVLAAKNNQQSLCEDIRLFLDDAIENGFDGIEHDLYEQTEKGHGRIETRRCWTTGQTEWLGQRHDWPGL